MKISFDRISEGIQQGYYRYLGSGSGRKVFDLGNGYVVKTAKNKKGIAQNEAEYAISSVDNSGLFAKIYKLSEDHRYLIMQKAEPIKSLAEVWDYYQVSSNRELFRLEAFHNSIHRYHLLQADLCRPTNWGIIHGKPVIIDYGFTSMVRKKYYTPL
jgi:hypothetical protein